MLLGKFVTHLFFRICYSMYFLPKSASFFRIMRGDPPEDIFSLNSTFFSLLEERGADAVKHYTLGKKKRNPRRVDIFTKKLVFIVINKDLHWSLMALVNPGQIFLNTKLGKDDEMAPSFLLHFDSLAPLHDGKEIAKNIYSWLQNQALNLHDDQAAGVTINSRTLPLCLPNGKCTRMCAR